MRAKEGSQADDEEQNPEVRKIKGNSFCKIVGKGQVMRNPTTGNSTQASFDELLKRECTKKSNKKKKEQVLFFS
jgi:hypothetical protein